jgi:hypothetical protein
MIKNSMIVIYIVVSVLLIGIGCTALLLRARVQEKSTNSTIQSTQTPSQNAQGLLGPRGPQGAQGQTGPMGPQGATGPSYTPKTYNGQYVVIQHRPNGNKTPVHAAEVQVFAFIDGKEIELPLNAGTLQKTSESCWMWLSTRVLEPGSIRGLSSRSKMKDEDLSTYMITDGTTDTDSIRIDLLREFPISRVVIYNRQDCCQDRLDECDLQLRDQNDRLVYTQVFPTPARQVYIFVW